MSTAVQTQQQQPVDKTEIRFAPFGTKDEIKLSLTIIKNFVAVKTKSGATCSDQQAMRFLMLAKAHRLDPFVGDCFLIGYDKRNKDGTYTPTFSMITAHQAFLKRAEVSDDYEGMESGIILADENGVVTEREGDFKMPTENVVGGWARVYRKGRKPTYRRLSISSMMPAYETPFWSVEKAPGQIVKCAESDALRSTFPTLLGGMYVADEMPMATVVDVSTVKESKLVANAPQESEPTVAEESPGEQHPKTTAQPKTAEPGSAQALAKVILDAGFTFDQFRVWATETENVRNADSLAGFDDVPEVDAKRLLRAVKGLLASLAQQKEVTNV